jgi:hypothetical protein
MNFYIGYLLTGIQAYFYYGPVPYLKNFLTQAVLLMLILILCNVNYSLVMH